MNCTDRPLCIPNPENRQQFLKWIETRTQDAAAVQRLQICLDLVDVDAKGYTQRDGRIDDAEFAMLAKAVRDYTAGYTSTSRFSFNELANKVAQVRDHQLAIWAAHRKFDEGCGCHCPE